MSVQVFDERVCKLGEGPMWHPGRGQLFWFDILKKRLLSRRGGEEFHWDFDEHVSAAGWVDHSTLLIASETALLRLDLETGEKTHVAALEAENALTRSNDGRADPWGGFWIGTMGKNAEPNAGAIYRFYRGQVTTLFTSITVSNAICFATDRSCAYFCDTRTRRIMRQALSETDGWPQGPPEDFIDLYAQGLNPDGAVVDAAGCLWNAQWGASRVARYAPTGEFLDAVVFSAERMTCPAFGGENRDTLFATSAALGMKGPHDGLTFSVAGVATGQLEYAVIL